MPPRSQHAPPLIAYVFLALVTIAAGMVTWQEATSLNSSVIAASPAPVSDAVVVTRIAYVPVTVTPTPTYQPPPWWATSRAIHDPTATALALLPPTVTPTPTPILRTDAWWAAYVEIGER